MKLPEHCHQAGLHIWELWEYGDVDRAAAHFNIAWPPALIRAVPQRRAEFLAGRLCATRALAAAGLQGPVEVAIGANRAPQWPAGYVGSIAHSHGYAWAAVARAEAYRGLGIDLEPVLSDAAAAELAERILTPLELARAGRADLAFGAYFTLLFSAKESLFKCLAPTVGRYFYFHDAELVALDAVAGRARLVLNSALSDELPAGMELDVAYVLEDGQVSTAGVWPRTAEPAGGAAAAQ